MRTAPRAAGKPKSAQSFEAGLARLAWAAQDWLALVNGPQIDAEGFEILTAQSV